MTKKASKIYSTDTEKLNAAITEAEGRATARTMNAEYVASKLLYVVNRYLNGMPKKALTGTRATIHASTEKLPSSYKYRAESTQAEFMHDGKGWMLVSVWRGTIENYGAPIFIDGLRRSPMAIDKVRDQVKAKVVEAVDVCISLAGIDYSSDCVSIQSIIGHYKETF